jgi:hypothetical protein
MALTPLLGWESRDPNVRLGSEADVMTAQRVRPLCANSGHKSDQPARIGLDVNPL